MHALLLALLSFQEDPLLDYIAKTAQSHLAARKQAIAAIKTPAQAAARQKQSREKILQLIGGLPNYKGPLNAKTVKTLDRGPFRIELVHFESLPNYIVSANLYLPKAPGKHPAVLYSAGHWDGGKIAGQKICTQLALKGFVCLAYDPVGQGERQQAFDKRIGRSLIGGSTEQHFMLGAQSILLGQTVARYFINDSQRGLDYLVSRPEVEATRIGASGCSGGGTQTTYIAALDPRVQVAAPACYMNSFEFLITGPTGDSEQSFPGFLSSGLDQADYVYLFAPKPWLVASTEQDFFTPAAAEIVVNQARNFYEVFGKPQNIKWVVGPGGHGTPLVVREAIYEWMIRHLKNGQGNPQEEPFAELLEADLCVFSTCQVPGVDLTSILAEQAPAPAGEPLALPAPLRLSSTKVIGPPDARELFLMPAADLASEARAKDLATHGKKVMLVTLPGYPIKPNAGRLSGDWITHTRAWLAGLNLPLLRAADLAEIARQEIPKHDRVILHGWGVGGIPAILAAKHIPGLAGLWLERTPVSLVFSLSSPVHRNLHEGVIPGILEKTDFPGLLPAKSLWVDPTDWNENITRLFPRDQYYLRPFEQSTRELLEKVKQSLP